MHDSQENGYDDDNSSLSDDDVEILDMTSKYGDGRAPDYGVSDDEQEVFLNNDDNDDCEPEHKHDHGADNHEVHDTDVLQNHSEIAADDNNGSLGLLTASGVMGTEVHLPQTPGSNYHSTILNLVNYLKREILSHFQSSVSQVSKEIRTDREQIAKLSDKLEEMSAFVVTTATAAFIKKISSNQRIK